MTASNHTPVMLEEAIRALAVAPGGRYIDATLGGGGHAAAILEHSYPGGQLLGIDAAPEAIEKARQRLAAYEDSVLLVNNNFSHLEAICLKYDFFPVHGILFDLGLSSMQLDSGQRGFSFQQEASLDMRFNPAQKLSAADIVNGYSEAELARILKDYGEEPFAARIARRIIGHRPINTTTELARLVETAVGGRKGRIHPATRTFQALRIATNGELENLDKALKQAVNMLGFGGRLVVISYHSLEDRIAKRFMQAEARDCVCQPGTPVCICGHVSRLRLLSRKVITPSAEEVKANPRARSARMRAAERVVNQEVFQRSAEKMFFLDERAWERRQPVLLRQALRAWAPV